MTYKQVALVIGINALISTFITVLLVVVILPALGTPAPVAQVTPTAMPTQVEAPEPVGSTPSLEPVMHEVQSGDTISALAFRYDVPEEDIIAANDLQNPNLLQVGMQLIIPVGGLPAATATFTPAPTATDTPLPFEPPSADMTATAAAEAGSTATPLPTPVPAAGDLEVEISEIIGVGRSEQERVVITNTGEQLADMAGWTLSDTDGNVYEFANFRLWRGGSVTVHTRIGQDGTPPANFYWGKLGSIWSAGEVAMLRDAAGQEVSTYTVAP
ncbi:MAG: lamin tail domain-containing protein [Anaerolineae bacterium]